MSDDGSTTLQGTPNPEAPNPQLPIVQKLRVRYAKRGRLRFTSHRDFGRAFERAVRRARIPIAYSSGFTPHPKISYANAAPTGAASEAEFLEIGLTRECDPEQVRRSLDSALPPGLDVVAVVPSEAGTFADRLESSLWSIETFDATGLSAAAGAFLAATDVTVERMTKRGLRDIDVRGAVVSVEVADEPGHAVVRAVVRSTIPTVRPDDVIGALRQFGAEIPGATVATRLAQGPLRDGAVGDPLA